MAENSGTGELMSRILERLGPAKQLIVGVRVSDWLLFQGNGWPANSTASDSLADDVAGRGHPQRTSGEQRDRAEPKDDEEDEDEEDEAGGREEDYEGEDEGEAEDDVYEDELKAAAESHEAMSRDDARNPNASSTVAATAALLADGTAPAANNFDSREVITVNDSDEDVASNEAITDELVDKYDQEVRGSLFSRRDSFLLHFRSVRCSTRACRSGERRFPWDFLGIWILPAVSL